MVELPAWCKALAVSCSPYIVVEPVLEKEKRTSEPDSFLVVCFFSWLKEGES